MSRTGYLLLLLSSLLLTLSCQPREKKKVVVGLSQCMLDDAWRQAMIRETLIEAYNYDNLEVIIRNADTNNKQQIEQVRELINMGVDVLIISPNEGAPLTPIAEEAYNRGIPTIITDRKISGDKYTTFVGASNYQIGIDAGKYAANYLPQDAVILEIWGLSTSSPAQERHEGFVESMRTRPDVSLLKLDGEWRYDTASVRLNRMPPPEKIDLVYAHNDMMAIAAREYLMKLDPVAGAKVHIIGVDAAPGAGLEAIADGRIDVSFIYPRGGEQVIRAALKLAAGEPVDKYIPLNTAQVDKEVARTLLLQADQLSNYQNQIETQLSRLDELFGRYNFLRNSIAIISILLIGLIGLTIYAFSLNRKKEKQRMKLLALNAEIIDRRQLQEQFLQKLRENHQDITEPEQPGHIDDLFLRRLLEQLEEVYTDSEFNVERLSDLLGISRGHLYRKVKDITGITPVELLRNFRLGKAVQLLRERKLSVSEIAYQTGFTSPSYFTKCFKTVYNTTPTEF